MMTSFKIQTGLLLNVFSSAKEAENQYHILLVANGETQKHYADLCRHSDISVIDFLYIKSMFLLFILLKMKNG